MRSGIAVFCVCLLVAIGMALYLRGTYRGELSAVQDLMLGLMYFMEQHEGRFPASEGEFRAASFVEKRPDGTVCIRPPAETRFRRETHGIPIADLQPFAIRWGTDMASLTIDRRGKVRDAQERIAELIRWPSSPPSANEYSLLLLRASEELRAAAAKAAGQ